MLTRPGTVLLQCSLRPSSCRSLARTARCSSKGLRDFANGTASCGSQSRPWTLQNVRNAVGISGWRLEHSRHVATASVAQQVQASSEPKAAGPAISIPISNNVTQEFAPLLLRDLCSCPRCVNASTRQKTFSTIDIPRTIAPKSVAIDGPAVRIAWDNDIPGWPAEHITELDLGQLQRFAHTGTAEVAPHRQRALWNASKFDNETSDISYKAYMEDEETLHKVVQQLYSHGLAFITDVPADEKSVSTLAERIAPVKNTFYGYTWDVRSVPQAINVAYTSGDLGLHMDLLYMYQPPHLQLLHCIRASSAGGASMFTDSFRAAAELLQQDPAAFLALTRLPVHFHYNHPGSQYYHQPRRVIELRDRSKQSQANLHQPPTNNVLDEIEAISWAPPFQGPFIGRPYWDEHGQQIGEQLQEWHEAAQKFNALIEKQQGIYERMMQPGVCVIFDNRRVLHARRAFAEGDVGKERWLRGAYVDEDAYHAKMRVLEARFM